MRKAAVINDIIGKLGGNVSTIETALGYKKAGLYKAIAANSDLKTEKVEKLLEMYPQINPIWLFVGKGEMILNSEGSLPPPSAVEKDYRTMWEDAVVKINNKLFESVDTMLILVKEIALSLVQAQNDRDNYAQTQIGILRGIQASTNYLVESSGRGQTPLNNPDSKSSLPDGGKQQAGNDENEGN